MTKPVSWTESFFDALYKEIFMNRSAEQIGTAYSRLTNSNLTVGSVCDFCCGTADILEYFKNKGWDAHGIDYSREYIEVAQKERNMSPSNLICADATSHQFSTEFDLVYSWHSSLGYQDEEFDVALIQNMYKHMKKGATLAIELYNIWAIAKNFKETIYYKVEKNAITYDITRTCEIDLLSQRMNQVWTYSTGTWQTSHNTSMRLYSPASIVRLLKNVGITDIQIFDSTKAINTPADIHSPRLLFKGLK